MATEPDREQASWLAFLLALAGSDDPELQDAIVAAAPRFAAGELPEPLAGPPARRGLSPMGGARGLQVAGYTGEVDWSPQRRFARVFERLALPGIGRAARFDLLVTLGAAGLYDLEPDQLQLGVEDDATTQAAKRTLLSGDKMLLERRARDLAVASSSRSRRSIAGSRSGATPARGSSRETSPRRDALRPRAAVSAARGGRGPARTAAADPRVPRARGPRPPAPRRPHLRPLGMDLWGREITEWNLDTRTGPSWKPLPVLFTTPFALAGDSAAPELWLVIAQAGGLPVAFTYRLAARLAGWPAGLIAVAGSCSRTSSSATSPAATPRACSSALCLWAIERHLDGHATRRSCSASAAGLLRPELWPFLLFYGLWLMWTDPPLAAACGRLRRGSRWVLWFVPEYLGSGDLFRAASRAREAQTPTPPRSPTSRSWRRSAAPASVLMVPLLLGAVIALVPRLARPRPPCGWLLGATRRALMVAVAAMTQVGLRRQPALRRAAGRAGVRAGRRGLGRPGPARR